MTNLQTMYCYDLISGSTNFDCFVEFGLFEREHFWSAGQVVGIDRRLWVHDRTTGASSGFEGERGTGKCILHRLGIVGSGLEVCVSGSTTSEIGSITVRFGSEK